MMHKELVYSSNVFIHTSTDKRRWNTHDGCEAPFSIEASEESSWNEIIGGSDSLAPSWAMIAIRPFLIDDLSHRIESEELTRSE